MNQFMPLAAKRRKTAESTSNTGQEFASGKATGLYFLKTRLVSFENTLAAKKYDGLFRGESHILSANGPKHWLLHYTGLV